MPETVTDRRQPGMTETIRATRCTPRIRAMANTRIEELGFSNDSEYVRHLIIRDFTDAERRLISEQGRGS